MKEGWKYVDFKDVYPIKMGKTPPRSDASSWDKEKTSGEKWVSIADISSHQGKTIYDTKEYISKSAAEKIYKVAKGSLLMSFKLSIGRMAFAGDDLYTNEAIIAIPESKEYELKFIFYYLSCYDWLSLTEGNEKVKGATLNKQSIGKIKLPFVSLSEQEEIVTYLDTSFAKIDAIKANAEKELEEAKKLFAAALNEAMTPKEGWVEKKMEDIVDKNTNISYGIVQPGDEYNNGVPVVRPIDLGPKVISLNSQLKRTNPANSIAYKRTILNGKEILMCVRGTTGVVSLTDKTLIDCNVTRGIVPLKIDDDNSRCFVYYALLSTRPNTFILQNTKGAALKQINIADVKRIPIWIPSLTDQHSIVAHLDTLSEKVRQLQSNYEKISSECDALKQAILRDTFE